MAALKLLPLSWGASGWKNVDLEKQLFYQLPRQARLSTSWGEEPRFELLVQRCFMFVPHDKTATLKCSFSSTWDHNFKKLAQLQTSSRSASSAATGSRNHQPDPLESYKLFLNRAFAKVDMWCWGVWTRLTCPLSLTSGINSSSRNGAVWEYRVVEEVVVLLQYYTLSILTHLCLTFNNRAIWFRTNSCEMQLLYIYII